MQHTQNYQLSRWEKDDRIMMEDFNADNEKIDAALKANADAVSAEADARRGAVSALQTGKADAAATAAAITAVEQSVKFVKLGSGSAATANESVSFGLTNTEISAYTALLIVTVCTASRGSASVSVNGTELFSICSNNWSSSAGIGWIVPCSGKILGFSQGVCASDSETSALSDEGAVSAAWDAVTSVSVSGGYDAGMTCALYGIK